MLRHITLKRIPPQTNCISEFPKMARRYDTRTTIFSPEGRLYQVWIILRDCPSTLLAEKTGLWFEMRSLDQTFAKVEYAMEAIGHAGTCLGERIFQLQKLHNPSKMYLRIWKSGILSNEGVVLAAERRNTNKLLDEVVLLSGQIIACSSNISSWSS